MHLTQVINGHKTEIHVCESCAKEKGYVSEEEEPYSLHNLLSGLFHFDTSAMEKNSSNQTKLNKELTCSKCGLTYKEFTQVGKFGCASCYQTFGDNLNPIFRRVHSGNTTHEGKVPRRIGSDIYQRKKLTDLKRTLQQLITDEAFEEAAKVRDEIKSLERDLNQDGEGEA